MRLSEQTRRVPLERIAVAAAVGEANHALAVENEHMAKALTAAMDQITQLEIENNALRRLTAEQGRTIAALSGRQRQGGRK